MSRQVVQRLTRMVGRNVKLYDMVLQFLRTLFLRTRNVHYCTLRAELLMSLHDLDVGDVCSVDPCHKVGARPALAALPSPWMRRSRHVGSALAPVLPLLTRLGGRDVPRTPDPCQLRRVSLARPAGSPSTPTGPARSGLSGASGPPLPQSPRGLLTGELCVQEQGFLHCPCPGIGAGRPQTASLPRGFAASHSEPALPPRTVGAPEGPISEQNTHFASFLHHLACGDAGTWACFPSCRSISGDKLCLGDLSWGSRCSPKAQETSGSGECRLEAAVSGRVLTTPPPRSSRGAWTLASESGSWTARGPGSCRASSTE